MHPRVFAQRTAAVDARILAAARTLAKEYRLEAPLAAIRNAAHRDPQVHQLQTREAIADLLEGLAEAALHGGDTDAALPITGYDDLTAAEVRGKLAGLSADDLRAVADYEATHENRSTVLKAIERAIGEAEEAAAAEPPAEPEAPAPAPEPVVVPEATDEVPEPVKGPAR